MPVCSTFVDQAGPIKAVTFGIEYPLSPRLLPDFPSSCLGVVAMVVVVGDHILFKSGLRAPERTNTWDVNGAFQKTHILAELEQPSDPLFQISTSLEPSKSTPICHNHSQTQGTQKNGCDVG